jgi:SP family myo-inositol transporter-like MFS transporter 13
LIKVGETERARGIMLRAYGTESNAAVEALIRAIDLEIREEEEAATNLRRRRPQPASLSCTSKLKDRWAELIEIDSNRRAFTIACMLQGLQQLCGFNSLMYFSATIFASVGFGSPILASFSVAVTNFVFTLVAVYLIDSVGRRRILLLTLPVMVAGLLLTALAFTQLPVSTVALMKQDVSFAAIAILLSLIIFVASYALGMGNVPWQQSELFPLSVRSLGSGVATSMNWGSNFVVGLTFLPMMQLLTPGWTFVLYAGICAAGWIAVWRIYPETKGLGLEEVGSLLKDGWGVEESLERM